MVGRLLVQRALGLVTGILESQIVDGPSLPWPEPA
jgi:hypothetical protein